MLQDSFSVQVAGSAPAVRLLIYALAFPRPSNRHGGTVKAIANLALEIRASLISCRAWAAKIPAKSFPTPPIPVAWNPRSGAPAPLRKASAKLKEATLHESRPEQTPFEDILSVVSHPARKMVSGISKPAPELEQRFHPGDDTRTSTTVDSEIDCCTASIINVMSHVLDLLSVLAIMLGLLHRLMWSTQPQQLPSSHIAQQQSQHLQQGKSQQSSVQMASSDSAYSFSICPQIMFFNMLSLCWKHRGKISVGGGKWLAALKQEIVEMFDGGMAMEPSYRARMLWSGTNMIHSRTRLAVVPLMTIVEEDMD